MPELLPHTGQVNMLVTEWKTVKLTQNKVMRTKDRKDQFWGQVKPFQTGWQCFLETQNKSFYLQCQLKLELLLSSVIHPENYLNKMFHIWHYQGRY